MKTKYNKITILMLLIGLMVGVTASPIMAQETASFSISAVIPENQIDTNLSYFDLLVQPDQKQTIQIQINNSSDKPIIANTRVNAASTSNNGNIDYNTPGVKDKSMKHSIEDIANVIQTETRVEANGTALVDIELTMPSASYDGVILGGILVTADFEDANTDENNEGINIENQIAYALGLKLTQTDVEVTPNMELHQIQPDTMALRTAMAINLQNTEAIIMKNVKIHAEIYQQGSDTILRQATRENAEIAPNTNFNFMVDWEDERIEAGMYRLKMRVDYGDHYWEWDEEFEVTTTDSNTVNDDAINVSNNTSYWIYALVVVIILAILYFIFARSRNRDREKRD